MTAIPQRGQRVHLTGTVTHVNRDAGWMTADIDGGGGAYAVRWGAPDPAPVIAGDALRSAATALRGLSHMPNGLADLIAAWLEARADTGGDPS